MTLKERLIQEIERSPDEVLEQLLEILQKLQPTALVTEIHTSRLHRKQGVLIVQTGERSTLDLNAFINEIREERIQDQIQLVIE